MKKKILALGIAVISCFSLYAWKTDANLKSSDESQELYLYNDGTCVKRAYGGRGTGTYDLNGGKIYITWDNGEKEQGSYQMKEGQLKSVYLEGVNFSRSLIIKRR